MNKLIVLYIVIVSFFMANSLYGQAISSFSGKEMKIENWIDANFKKGKHPPFSFVYESVHSGSFIKRWSFSSQKLGEIEKGVFNNVYRWQDEKTKMSVECDVKYYPEYRAVEWVLGFTNGSPENSASIEQVKVIDMSFQYGSDGEIILHYADGSTPSRADFHPRKKILTHGEPFEIYPHNGRSSDHAFPFFNIESTSGQGAIFAIGWTGTWYAHFEKKSDNAISFDAGMKNLNTYLKGNESIRTPSICLLFWNDKDRMTGHNAFRRFMINHQTPKIDGKPAVYPVSTSFNYGDPHPCNEYTCLTTDYALAMINRYKRFKLVPEVFWLDAGWYIKANEVENNKNWANTVGYWEIDNNRFPGGFKPIADAIHEAGAKFMVWFEPERVIKESNWGIELKEWMLDAKGTNAYLFDLGNKDALSWLCKFIGDFMEENGIDYYRQDFNMRVDNYWRENEETGRIGIGEIRHIEGLYAFWDYLLKRFPEAIIDNCASGGRRLDFESMKRSAPLWRTDYSYGEPVGYQTHTYGLSFFLPLTGTGVEKNDKFTFRSSLGTSVIFNWKITDASSSFIEMQRCFKEFMDMRPYFYEDYYPLTSYEDMTTDDIWLAYQLHRPSDDTGIIVAFRREQSSDKTIEVKLSAVDHNKTYRVTDRDTGESFVRTGDELRKGLQLTLKEPRSSLIFEYGE
ncbi:MAG: alpha-galactosidase [Bacteroidales bacterium]|nr:alpha-galactosidase [Bacteroidales bacterium]